MDNNTIILWLLGILGAIIAFLINKLWKSKEEERVDIKETVSNLQETMNKILLKMDDMASKDFVKLEIEKIESKMNSFIEKEEEREKFREHIWQQSVREHRSGKNKCMALCNSVLEAFNSIAPKNKKLDTKILFEKAEEQLEKEHEKN